MKPTPVHISHITTQDQLTTFEVTGPVLINDLYIETVIIGTKDKDKITGTSDGEILRVKKGGIFLEVEVVLMVSFSKTPRDLEGKRSIESKTLTQKKVTSFF